MSPTGQAAQPQLPKFDVGLINIVVTELTQDPCNGFRRAAGPADDMLVSIPAMASFAAAALERGIEHDSITGLYEVNAFADSTA